LNQIRACFAAALLALLIPLGACATTSAKTLLPDPAVDDSLSMVRGQGAVVLAGGCFWGMQEVFQHVRGVIAVTAGYAGGSAQTATYEMVETSTTGHAESVKITYDPSRISYGQILKVFFSVAHDPTQLNAQWPDVGPQYRSVIFYANDRQQQVAQAYVSQLLATRLFRGAIVTELVPLTAFYPAEAYHQNYAARHALDPYIVTVDRPKLIDLRKQHPGLYVD
jgi:peptide-methionine (S)-S-oxide reductase